MSHFQQPPFEQPGQPSQQQMPYPQPSSPFHPDPPVSGQYHPMPPGYQPPSQFYPQPPYPAQPGNSPPLLPGQHPQPYQVHPSVQMMSTTINVSTRSGPGCLVRALYFCFIGWWLGFLWLHLGFALCAFLITIPLGLMMLNRLPQVLTLRSSGSSTSVNVSTTQVAGNYPGTSNVLYQQVNVNITGTQQTSFLVRVLYFCLVGWWLGYMWALMGYICCVSIVLLPIGIMMLHRLPAVMTLRKN